jgi:hypothetical protein
MDSTHLWLGLLLLQVKLTDMETCTQQATTWHCGIEHSAVQHRIHMRNVLLAGVLRRIIPLVFTQIHHSDGH